jgi:ketosteroid isomerase-like protein
MYKTIVKRRTRAGHRLLSEGRFDELVAQFAPDVHFVFAGDSALAADLRGRDRVRAWFERVGRLLPGLRLDARTIVVDGWPWDTRIATHFTVETTLDGGRAYRNAGLQLIRLRWGRVTEDHLYEDTQRVAEALAYLAGRGVAEATAPPIG